MSWALELNGELLGTAQQHYNSTGFRQIATPWLVGETAFKATCPPDTWINHPWKSPLNENDLYHVASAEQGFLQMLLDGNRLVGRFQSTTPCFRYETYDNLHQPYFYKLELFSSVANLKEVGVCILAARKLFENLGVDTRVIQTDEQTWDVIDKVHGIELGSYGIRKLLGHEWTYGTGLAIPRFSYVKEISSNE